MVTVKNLNFSLTHFQLKADELVFPKGQLSGLFGPSGSGKTTFFKILMGVNKAPNWNFIIEGKDFSQTELDQRRLGIVFQSSELFYDLTAQQNVEIVMKARNNWSENSREQLFQFIKKLNLQKCWSTKAQNLSGGEKQRVALLRAIMSDPQLLLLDEPFASLDEANKISARQILMELIKDLKLTALIISHDFEDQHLVNGHKYHIKSGCIVLESKA